MANDELKLDDDRLKRLAAVNFARGSVRLSDFFLGEEAEWLNQEYVNGKITSSELLTATLRRFKP
jgi:hypothetical protein